MFSQNHMAAKIPNVFNMAKTISPKQFAPDEQFEQALNEIGEKLIEFKAMFERLEWLKEKTAESFAATRARAERFEVFTEAQAAERLKISERKLADLRRTGQIPHIAFGTDPRYTTEHLFEICRILESRPRGTSALKMAA